MESMGMELRVGGRYRSAVCETQVIVVRAPTEPVALECGGSPMLVADDEAAASAVIDPAHTDGTAIGKRYADAEIGLEVLCTRAGAGSLTLAGEDLRLKEAKPLPSSD